MKHPLSKLRTAFAAALGLTTLPALGGELILDGSTTPSGRPARLDGPQFILDEGLGLRRGANLFHSLAELTIEDSEGLFLTGSPTIDNVLLRVTGGRPAVINGQLTLLIDDANLFLLNPAGVVFGERAQLNVPGTVMVSTGEAIVLADGARFPAIGPLPALSAAPPAAWHDYGAPLSGEIVIDATLQVNAGAFLLADRITFNQGALVAGPNLFSVPPPSPAAFRRAAAPGPLRLLANTAIEANGLASPNLANVNSFNWSADAASEITLTAPLINLNAGGIQSLAFGDGDGANLRIAASDLLSLGGFIDFPSPTGPIERFAGIGTGTRGAGAGGDLLLTAGRLTLTDRAAIVLTGTASGVSGSQRLQIGAGGLHLGPQTLIASYVRPTVDELGRAGDGGSIDIDVEGALVMRGAIPEGAPLTGFNMGIVSKSLSNARAGDINVRAVSLDVADGGRIESGALGTGRTGDVWVEASQHITVSGGSQLLNSLIGVLASERGSVGDTTVRAPQIEILDGASVRADSLGSGAAGTLTLQADRLRIAGAGAPIDEDLFAQWIGSIGEGAPDPVDEGESEVRVLQFQLAGVEAAVASDALDGEGGDLVLDVGLLDIGEGGLISATSLGDADGGDITIAADRVRLDGDAAIVTDAGRFLDDGDADATGNAGQIAIEANQSIRLTGGSISSNSLGQGDAGGITLTAPQIELSGGQAVVTTVSDGAGNAGNIRLQADEVRIAGGALNAQARGAGSGGNVQVQANASLSLVDAMLTASSGAAGGGSLEVRFGNATPALIRDSVLSADTQTGDEQAGSVVVQAIGDSSTPSAVVLNNAQLLANADGGAAGNVLVQAGAVIRDGDSRLAASNRAGLSGPVEVQEQSQNTQIDAAAEPPSPEDPATQIGSCRAASAGSLWVRHEAVAESPATVLLAVGGGASSPDHGAAPAMAARSLTATPTSSPGPAATRSVRQALDQDDLSRAYTLAQRAIKLTKTPATLATKAVVDYARADYLAAARTYEETARLARRQDAPAMLARAHANAGRAWLLAARPARALEQLRLAQAVASRLPVNPERALVMLHLGQSWMSAATVSGPQAGWPRLSALTALRDANATAQALGDRSDLLAWSLGLLSELYAIDQQHDSALALAWQALETGEHSLDAYRWYRQVARLLQEAGRAERASELYARAVALSARAAGDRVRDSQTREAHFRRQIAPVYLEYAALLMTRAQRAEQPAQSEGFLLDAREVINRLHAAEIRDYLQERCDTVAPADTRTLIVDADTAVIFPVVFDDRVDLLIQTTDGLRRAVGQPLPRTQLTRMVGEFREQLRDPRRSGATEQARKLYGAVFAALGPVLAADSPVERLVFVPDGPLRLLPLGALHDGSSWLAERAVVEVVQRLAPAPLPLEGARLGKGALLAGVSRFGDGDQPALPYVPEELDGISAAWRGRSNALRDEQFTKRSFFETLGAMRPSVLHVATHGTFTGSLEHSYLVTGDGEQLGIQELFLPLQQLAARKQPVDLVVLSACDTAVGVERSAIGLAGVALRAGAGHAAGALWPVPDDGTAKLFQAFYTHLEGEALGDPSLALALAQRELLASERYPHPAYWAGFQIISNGIPWGTARSPTMPPALAALPSDRAQPPRPSSP